MNVEQSASLALDHDRYHTRNMWLGSLYFIPLILMSTVYLMVAKSIADSKPWEECFQLAHWRAWLGYFTITLFLISSLVLYARYFHREFLSNHRKVILLVTTGILTIGLGIASFWASAHLKTPWNNIFFVPVILPINALICCVLLGKRISLFVTGVLLVIMGSGSLLPQQYMIVNAIAYLAVIGYASRLRKRRDIFKAFLFSWFCTLPVSFGFYMVQNSCSCKWLELASYMGGALASSIAFAIISISILPVFEYLFKLITNMTLIEFMDPNLEILRRLSMELPGTYQHCLVVGNLAELAAQSIGANGLFCRVSTLYHDIGKLYNPHFFTENQTANFNIHQLLTPLESAQVIIAHVREGENIARKYHLPRSFIDIIREHHGTTLVYYFYYKQVELMGGDPAKVDETAFRYPGPKPRTKESAMIMLADSIEAASRSIDLPDEDTFTHLVNRIVKEKVMDGQLDDCQLTFEELTLVKKSFVKTLMISRHMRVKYPKAPPSKPALTTS